MSPPPPPNFGRGMLFPTSPQGFYLCLLFFIPHKIFFPFLFLLPFLGGVGGGGGGGGGGGEIVLGGDPLNLVGPVGAQFWPHKVFIFFCPFKVFSFSFFFFFFFFFLKGEGFWQELHSKLSKLIKFVSTVGKGQPKKCPIH